jgi:hypothetical protein
MANPDSVPEVSPESVRTLPQGLLVGSLCPICQEVELHGRQTVCSAACRRERSRQKQASELSAQVARIGQGLASIGQGLELLRARHDALAERVDRMTQRSPRRRIRDEQDRRWRGAQAADRSVGG